MVNYDRETFIVQATSGKTWDGIYQNSDELLETKFMAHLHKFALSFLYKLCEYPA
jgi:hypothetical protein